MGSVISDSFSRHDCMSGGWMESFLSSIHAINCLHRIQYLCLSLGLSLKCKEAGA